MNFARAFRSTFFAAAVIATAAPAQTPTPEAIQNHEIQRLFIERPCSDVIATIDGPQTNLKDMGMMTMAFGVIMGLELARPGIRGNEKTALVRLRSQCAQTPNTPAFEILYNDR